LFEVYESNLLSPLVKLKAISKSTKQSVFYYQTDTAPRSGNYTPQGHKIVRARVKCVGRLC